MFNKKITLIYAMILLVLSVFVFAAGWLDDIGLPPSEGDDDETPPPSAPTEQNIFEIREVDVNIDGEKETITRDGDSINEYAKEESNVQFDVKIKNLLEDQAIDDVKIKIIIQDINDADDLYESSTRFDLDAGESYSKKLKFEIPLKVCNGNYDVNIHVEGKDQNNNKYENDWESVLKIRKNKHKVIIKKASLPSTSIKPGKSSDLTIKIINLGREDENVNIEIRNNDLGINLKKENIQLKNGIDSDSEYEDKFRLDIPYDAKEGEYNIMVNAYYNDNKFSAIEKVKITVENKKTDEIKSLVEVKNEKINAINTEQKISGRATKAVKKGTRHTRSLSQELGNEIIVLLLIISIILATGLIIFLIGAVIIKSRK